MSRSERVSVSKGSIAILGAGAWGAALAMLLSKNGATVHLWDVSAERLAQLQKDRACFGVPFSDRLIITPDLT